MTGCPSACRGFPLVSRLRPVCPWPHFDLTRPRAIRPPFAIFFTFKDGSGAQTTGLTNAAIQKCWGEVTAAGALMSSFLGSGFNTLQSHCLRSESSSCLALFSVLALSLPLPLSLSLSLSLKPHKSKKRWQGSFPPDATSCCGGGGGGGIS